MGLAERKDKQRIGNDPRNLTWSGDKSRFSYKHMSSLGWNEKSGLGGDLSGNPNNIAVARKLDNGGIGMGRARKEGDDQAAGAGQAGRGLEDVLKRLAQASASPSPSPVPEVILKGGAVSRNRIASRQKHLNSKRLAAQSPAALAEILGVSISSLPSSPTPTGSSTPMTTPPISNSDIKPSLTELTEPERTAEETISTSTLSVADYFRQKMREKMASRLSNGHTAPELRENSLARIKDEIKPAIGGVEFEGSKVKFEEVKVELEHLGGEAGPSEVKPSEKELMRAEKAARRQRKEAKKWAKAAALVVDVKPTRRELDGVVLDVKTKDDVETRRRKEGKKMKMELEQGAEGKESQIPRKRSRDGDGKDGKVKRAKRIV